ncbi:hypothetical protein AHGSH82_012970 [Aeromonas hydrophila]|uniref:hypothetical protein n=1 Tax=Aeromonas hydrophila TaxID=644 RepID=UPI00101B07EB|nr:hypothetical protein [Aeromonas hydrophila]BBG84152.1 hypothetical protein AHGSH82_012970 [Aeromonas hydrophila]BBT61485.1 hypothetical protein WP8S18E02_12820 [Aeromonas hydrophila]
MIKRIDKITISNVKGIANSTFDIQLIPNKPTLIVAPNGFGKSSITAAFRSLRSKRMELDKDEFHKGDENLHPSFKISYTMKDDSKIEKEANQTKNELTAVFGVHVINSQLVSKAKKLKIAGANIVTSAIEVTPIVLIKNIPEKSKFTYSHAKEKESFGKNGKVLPNISNLLTDNRVMAKIWNQVDFSKQAQVGVKNKIKTLQDEINAKTGNSDQILASVKQDTIQAVSAIDFVDGILTSFAESGINHTSRIETILAALQIGDIHASDKDAFKKAGERANYLFEKAAYIEDFTALKDTWRNIQPKETVDGLVISFPKANQISNGERDIICFVAQLKKAKLQLKKNKTIILVIDEIFDYLDDANLVACQYYLTQMISELKSEGRQIFPLIMTHLNPGFFKNFTFSDQKVCYLNKIAVTDKAVVNIISKRDDPTISDAISKYFLHFHSDDIDLSNEFQSLGLPAELATAFKFSVHCNNQLQRYVESKSFDPLAVCSGVRRQIERLSFKLIEKEYQNEFLSTKKTVNKLQFAQSTGVTVPEVYFLLAVIYNDAMHVRSNQDNFSGLGAKLANLTIKHMISTLV